MSNNDNIISRWQNLSTRKRIPLQASLELTNRCNERCTHCYLETFKDDPKRVLTLKDWQKILVELRSAGTLYIILMGGEAMLSPFFWDIADFAHRMKFHLSMITNGLKINSLEVAQRLKDLNFSALTFSVYSLQPEVHDKMTSVKGSLSKTMKAIELVREVGLTPYLNCLLTKQNVEHVFELYDWCMERDIELKVDPMVTPKLNGDLSPTRYRVSEDQLRWFYSERIRRWPKSQFEKTKVSKQDFVCNAAKGKCAITAYGELLPCIEVREPLGLLTETSFQELWNKSESKVWSDIFQGQLKSDKIELSDLSICDHCPGMSKNELNDPLQVAPFTEMVTRVKSEFAFESNI